LKVIAVEIGEVLKWITGIALTITTVVIGYIVSAHRALGEHTREEHRRLHEKIDQVSKEAARKDDMERHMERVERMMAEFRQEVNAKFDQLMRLLTENLKH
jgi:hypothetical protein